MDLRPGLVQSTFRAVVFAADGVVQSRRNNDLAARFPGIVTAALSLGDLVVDGNWLRYGMVGWIRFTGCDTACSGRCRG